MENTFSGFRLTVDETGAPILNEGRFVVQDPSGQQYAVEDTPEVRAYYEIPPPPLANEEILVEPATSQRSTGQNLEVQAQEQNSRRGPSKWTNSATLFLIHCWSEKRARFENNSERNEPIWDEVVLEMQARGYNFTSRQVEYRFKYLKHNYTACVDKNRTSTGVPEDYCNYYWELDSLFRTCPQIRPPALAASRPIPEEIVHHSQPHSREVYNEFVTQQRASHSSSDNGASNNPLPVPDAHNNLLPVPNALNPQPAPNAINPLPVPVAAPAQQGQSGRGASRGRPTRMERTVGRWAEGFRQDSFRREEARAQRHENLMSVLVEANRMQRETMQALIEIIRARYN